MSTNQEISDSDIFLELSVTVMKYSFKLNNGDPLCEKSPKNSRRDVESSAGGWGGHGHPQVTLNTLLGYFNFILDIP